MSTPFIYSFIFCPFSIMQLLILLQQLYNSYVRNLFYFLLSAEIRNYLQQQMKYLIFLFFVFVFSKAEQYVPIPSIQYGLSFGQGSKVHIQGFYDLLCIDTKRSNTILMKVLNQPIGKGIKFTYNLLALPYHLYSFKVNQGFYYILNNHGEYSAELYLQYVLNNQQKFYEAKWKKNSIYDFMEFLTYEISNILKIDQKRFFNALEAGSPQDHQSRLEWKYATGTLAVSGTPIFYANGVRLDGAESWNAEQWKKFIKKFDC